jgi:hypothetical protein
VTVKVRIWLQRSVRELGAGPQLQRKTTNKGISPSYTNRTSGKSALECERLVANRITFEAEKQGFLSEDQFGGRPGRNTLQAADAFIHQTRAQLDQGKVVSTIFFDLKGAFNGVSHRVIAEEMAACGFPRRLIAWVLAFLDGHLVTVIVDGERTVTFRCTDRGSPQGSALSLILFLLCINRLMRRWAAMGVVASWIKGFVDDLNLSTASRSVLENVRVLEKAGEIAKRGRQKTRLVSRRTRPNSCT